MHMHGGCFSDSAGGGVVNGIFNQKYLCCFLSQKH